METRLIERTPGGWRFSAYRWDEAGREAVLVPPEGVRGAHPLGPGVAHDIPGRLDCLACHGDRKSPVLGFSALQLSSDRDPLAPHAEAPEPGSVDLSTLVGRGLVRHLPPALDPARLRIEAPTPRERAARGWLHANCGSCHAAGGPLAGLDLALDARIGTGADPLAALRTTVGVPSRHRPRDAGEGATLRLAPGSPEASVLFRRLASRDPAEQMPPLGTRLVDPEARALLEAWIREDLVSDPHLRDPHRLLATASPDAKE